MYKLILYHLIICCIIGCSNTTKECEEKPLNPNGDSELAIVMRNLYLNTLDVKKEIIKNPNSSINQILQKETIERFTKNYLAINTAKPTEKDLRKDGIYASYTYLYINSVENFLNNKTKKNYNLMVSSCIQCHERFCFGAINTINKLHLK
ncbi:MAG: hypothetical protein P8J77_05135 [Flavobacteriales bacterium]|nr:hypothetical protein [Flavobacteriales bacterium]